MIHEVTAKTILRKYKKIDSWFVSSMGMNLYRGCTHNCVYCDGRDEKYRVEGDFGTDISVKTNAPAILSRELDPVRKRKPFPGGYVLLGGGVNDSYQPLEKKYRLSRSALSRIHQFYHPVHILTKSCLIEEDIDIIAAIHRRRGAIVSMSFSSVDEEISRVFEPGVPVPARRLETLKKFADMGIPCGIFLMPVIPFITDTPEKIADTLHAAKRAGVSFVIFGGMTLKPGRQREYFMNTLSNYAPEKKELYDMIYGYSPYGGASKEYYGSIAAAFNAAADYYNIPKVIPLSIYKDTVNTDERIITILDQAAALMDLKGERSPFSYASYQLSRECDGSGRGIEKLGGRLKNVKGVGPMVFKMVQEIINTGTCEYYERLCRT